MRNNLFLKNYITPKWDISYITMFYAKKSTKYVFMLTIIWSNYQKCPTVPLRARLASFMWLVHFDSNSKPVFSWKLWHNLYTHFVYNQMNAQIEWEKNIHPTACPKMYIVVCTLQIITHPQTLMDFFRSIFSFCV